MQLDKILCKNPGYNIHTSEACAVAVLGHKAPTANPFFLCPILEFMLHGAQLGNYFNRQFSKSFSGPNNVMTFCFLTRAMFLVFLNTNLIHCQTDYYGGQLSIYFLLITLTLLPQDDE